MMLRTGFYRIAGGVMMFSAFPMLNTETAIDSILLLIGGLILLQQSEVLEHLDSLSTRGGTE